MSGILAVCSYHTEIYHSSVLLENFKRLDVNSSVRSYKRSNRSTTFLVVGHLSFVITFISVIGSIVVFVLIFFLILKVIDY